MESSGNRSEMGVGGGVMLTKPTPSRPTLTLPPRNPAEAFLRSSDAPSPSPMTFVSGLFAEQDPYADCKSFSQLLAGAMASPSPRLGEGLNELVAPTDSPISNHISGMPAGGSFADRLAARGAGNKIPGGPGSPGTAPSTDAARLKLMTPSRIPIPSPYFTIPSGLSPTMLLDSPVLFSTGQAEPSPTTGSFPFASFVEEGTSALAPGAGGSKKRSSKEDGDFVFKPYPTLARNPLPLSSMGPFGLSHQQALAQVQAQAHSQGSSGSSGAGTPPVSESTSVFTSAPSFSGPKLVTPTQSQGPVESTAELQTKPSEKALSLQVSAPPLPPSHAIERPSEDGYNWRKYGQKQVKGSEYPRSYYKCTNPSCPVKKKVERSLDGQVTEIVYKGEHSHPKPQATRRGMSGAHFSDGAGREASHSVALEGAEAMNGKVDNDSAHPSSSLRGQSAPYNGCLSRTPEPSSGSTSDDDGEDDEASKAEGGGEDEPDSKHRRIENETLTSAPLRTIREPRVVVQTTSDVDILDDGYRWRKYGQKVVKGNPHPRSYYKCTNVGCSVRKHVERSSTDIKAVITTYEGKHNHDVPAARNSNHNTNGTAAASVPPPSLSGITSYWN